MQQSAIRSRAARLWPSVGLLLAFGAVGCNATPIPQPPPENLDVGKIVFEEAAATTNTVAFGGLPGAAPPNTVIRVTNLDGIAPPVAISVDADGSFSASISADFNDEIRFQVRDGDERLEPVDLVYDGGFSAPQRIDCLLIAPELDMGESVEGVLQGALTVQNDCPDDTTFDAGAFRTNDVEFARDGALPSGVPAGAAVDIGFTLAPGSAGEREEVFLLQVTTGSASARYPITLFGSGGP